MTIPPERTRAVICTREFLRDLLDARATPKVPRAIRERAYRCLKHYPGTRDILEVVKHAPGTWGKLDAH